MPKTLRANGDDDENTPIQPGNKKKRLSKKGLSPGLLNTVNVVAPPENISIDVSTIIENIIRGDSPYDIQKAFISIQNFDLSQPGAIAIHVHPTSPIILTKDAMLFETLCGDEDECGPSRLLARLYRSGKYKTVDCAMSDMVHLVALQGSIQSDEALRLTTLFEVWMKNVPWKNITLHNTNRPSLLTWRGWPWETRNFKIRSLFRGIDSNVIEVIFVDNDLPNKTVSQKFHHLIWTQDTETIPNIDNVLSALFSANCK